MTGLLLLLFAAVWLVLAAAIAYAATSRVKFGLLRSVLSVTVFGSLLVLPVVDEIVGGFQFRELCEKNAVFRIGVQQPGGRVTKFSANPANEIMPGTSITIYHTGVEYTDVQTGESVVKFDEYVAKGGVLIRSLAISESNSPVTMGNHACSPERMKGEAIHRTFKFSVIK